jgi:uncharacterized membrane protein
VRTLFIATFLANVAVTIASLILLPERVAIHFGADGTADGWAPSWVNALLMTGIHALLFVTVWISARLVLWFPPKWINLPNKDYWLDPARRPETMEKLQRFMWRFGVAMFLFLLVVGLLTLEANLAETAKLELRAFFPAAGIFLAYSVWWTIALLLAFRLPADVRDAGRSRGGIR